jgi:hypothetical protein
MYQNAFAFRQYRSTPNMRGNPCYWCQPLHNYGYACSKAVMA